MEQLTFIPTTGQFFLYEEEAPLPGFQSTVGDRLEDVGWPAQAYLVRGGIPEGPVEGSVIELLDALPILAGVVAGEGAPASIAAWSGAARAALSLLVRGRFFPRLRARPSREDDERIAGWEARWAMAPEATDKAPLSQLCREIGNEVALPILRRTRLGGVTVRSYGAPALLRRFLDVCADVLVREASRRGVFVRLGDWPEGAWEQRLVRALGDDRAGFAAPEADAALLAPELRGWADGEAAAPSLLPSPPSWRAPESLQAVLRRLQAPAAQLSMRLLNGEPAPRTLAQTPQVVTARLNQSIAVTRALLQMTGKAGTKRRAS